MVHSIFVADELDSYMYQTVGHHAIDLYAEAMGLPLYRRTIQGQSKVTGHDYTPTENDEVEDLYQLLLEVKVSRSQSQRSQVKTLDPVSMIK